MATAVRRPAVTAARIALIVAVAAAVALRMVPIFPFVLVNAAMALTALPVRRFYW